LPKGNYSVDLEQLQMHLAAPASSLGVLEDFGGIRPQFQLHWQHQVGSTNRELWRLMAAGAPAGTVFMASTQSAGRGQWGRQWQSPAGGLYLSLGLSPDVPVQHSPYLTLASSWGLATSLRRLGLPAQVKWPNDLVLQGKKLAGVLTETHIEDQRVKDVVIGLGLNGFNPVPPTGISVIQYFQPDLPPLLLNTLEGLAAVALYGVLQGYLYWQNYGNQALLKEYKTCMANLGQLVTLNDKPVQITGIAASGNLQVRSLVDHRQFAKTLEIEPGKVTLSYNA
jgi:BirA family biotin operon repressor/biotin-[acetyl-CoA-carboxylase] ligase